jgi:Holliday junction DNA helicase RuvA
LALAILSTHTPAALVDIIATNDLSALTLVPGVGKKTAERLLVELRNRLSLPMLDTAPSVVSSGGSMGDVREALLGLGYGAEEVRDTLRTLSAESDAATLLRDALKVLGGRRA